jgi:hypothetical protein
MYYFCINNIHYTAMNDESINGGLIEAEEPENSSLSKRAKYLSIIYYTISVSLLGVSFLPFFMKRVEGNDPHLVSGALSGSMQLLYFVLINIGALIVFLLGGSLLKFSKAAEDAEISDSAITILGRCFMILGVFSAASYIAGLIAILNFVA